MRLFSYQITRAPLVSPSSACALHRRALGLCSMSSVSYFKVLLTLCPGSQLWDFPLNQSETCPLFLQSSQRNLLSGFCWSRLPLYVEKRFSCSLCSFYWKLWSGVFAFMNAGVSWKFITSVMVKCVNMQCLFCSFKALVESITFSDSSGSSVLRGFPHQLPRCLPERMEPCCGLPPVHPVGEQALGCR